MHVPCNLREWLKINLTKKIKIFQSDGGGEFSNRKFAKHLHECGILHQMSYLGTPEQNGVAKRKHRHIVELGLTMMIAFNVPKRFWVEAFTIVIFEINRLPRNNLGINSPFSLLYGQEPKYSSLRVFDCRCFPYLRSYSSDKLKPRSLPCVFLGYSDQYRGYKCLHPPTHKIYIPWHVVFDENTLSYIDPNSLYSSGAFQGEVTSISDWEASSPPPSP